MAVLIPDWPAPAGVTAIYSDRLQGNSKGVYHSYNLGDHVGDSTADVASNREHFSSHLPASPCWLNQVHSTVVVNAAEQSAIPDADASIDRSGQRSCVVMTADCLPVLLCDRHATVVAAAHAGWRGLVNGVLENTVAAMRCQPEELLVWLGPAIGPEAFEVGAEVREQFVNHSADAAEAFTAGEPGKYFANIQLLARQRLQALGITAIYANQECTVRHSEEYFSYRRDGQTGRMAAAISLTAIR
ncbi:peptidoglycan editing factor PgeF [Aliagarivorans taiwanensis]|uniref:peptidoglycan editing factor PgeF n=1 Tax=Aliagarivorans taiwanensis TaxID=561966 RepID=UPI0003FBCCDC|nr:peptidoglycan editing factor PgeF [Aliagarivorans taiwanensis]